MTSTTKQKLFAWLPVLLYFGLIFYESSHPLPKGFPSKWNFDKICHFFAYFVAGILVLRAIRTIPSFKSPVFSNLISIVTVTLYGMSDELHQCFVPSRCADRYDLIANLLGCTVGVLLYAYIFQIRKKELLFEEIQKV